MKQSEAIVKIQEFLKIVGGVDLKQYMRWDDSNPKKLVPNGNLIISITQMYGYIPINFSLFKMLAELFGSDKIDEYGKDHVEGCESCDYGSRYTIEFAIKDPTTIIEWGE